MKILEAIKILTRKLYSLFPVFIIGITLTACGSSKFANKPTWRDEFSGDGMLDKDMWVLSDGKFGNELSVFADDSTNAYVKDGMLHIRVIKTDDPKYPYKSAEVKSTKPFYFKKGRIVVRAKSPMSKGIWPAIWFNGPKTKDGFFAEIDLMEHIFAMGGNSYKAVYHLWGDVRGKKSNHVSFGQTVDVNVAEWHVYELEVTDNNLVMKVDNREIWQITKGMFGEEWPTDQEYMLRLDVAYGGYGATKHGTDDSALPAEMLVDYVRFYEHREVSSNPK